MAAVRGRHGPAARARALVGGGAPARAAGAVRAGGRRGVALGVAARRAERARRRLGVARRLPRARGGRARGLWLEWASGERSALPTPAGLDERAARLSVIEPEPREPEPGGEVIDRAVLAERRARRAEAAEQAQARVASEALRALDALELRGTELEQRVEALSAERDALAEQARALEQRTPRDEHQRRALADALAAASAARRQSARRGGWRCAPPRSRARATPCGCACSRSARRRPRRCVASVPGRRRRWRPSAGGRRSWPRRRHAPASRPWRPPGISTRPVATSPAGSTRRRGWEGRATEAESALEQARGELAERETELSGARAELERVRGQVADLEAGLASERAARAEARGDAETARGEAASAGAALRAESVARAALEDELERERAARSVLSDALDAETDALASLHLELNAERAALAAERSALETLREAGPAPELVEELTRERAARHADQSALAALRDDLVAERAGREIDQAALAAERAGGRATSQRSRRCATIWPRSGRRGRRSGPSSTRCAPRSSATPPPRSTQIVPCSPACVPISTPSAPPARPTRPRSPALRAELEAAQARLTEAGAPAGGGLLDRVAELDRRAAGLADELAFQRRAREQAEAAAAAVHVRPPSPIASSPTSTPPLPPCASAPPTGSPPRPRRPAKPLPADAAAPAEAEAGSRPRPLRRRGRSGRGRAVPAAVSLPERGLARTIVSATSPPPREDATGRSQRQYPWLRGALVKLAHDDPEAAGRIIAGLLPVQAAIFEGPVDYDLTIAETGTYAVTVAGGRAYVKRVDGPRGRREAEFHLATDALTLAELIAGVPHRIGRFRGAARVTGRKRRVKPLKAIPGAGLSLAEAARAGARLEPALIFRTFPYVIHAAWTRDHSFTVAQQITGDPPETWYVTVGRGGGTTVESTPPEGGADATVTMTREAFGRLLRAEPVPAGQRPSVRGDRAAVALLKAWLDRAQGL